ncbi:MAG: hypothetical protein SGJ13_10320 [Actinomycetota bacterium]|nr:hypothetical protein [Actinomycetota bacterium]
MRGFTAVLAVVLLAMVAACGGDDDDGRSGDPQEVESETVGVALVARDQEGDGTVIVVDDVTLPEAGGYVVAYADGGGAPGVQIGASELLPGGESSDVEIALDPAVTETGDVFLIAHTEGNGNESFDGNADDPPAADEGNVLLVTVKLTVSET